MTLLWTVRGPAGVAVLAGVGVAATPPQLIILDEPTNHLDLDSIAAVEAALAAYDGALLVVSQCSNSSCVIPGFNL